MKTKSQIVAGGGWRETRPIRVKVKTCVALVIAIIFLIVSIHSSGTGLVYAWIPSVISLIVSMVLSIREQAIEVDSFAGSVGADPDKLYGRANVQTEVRTKNRHCDRNNN